MASLDGGLPSFLQDKGLVVKFHCRGYPHDLTKHFRIGDKLVIGTIRREFVREEWTIIE